MPLTAAISSTVAPWNPRRLKAPAADFRISMRVGLAAACLACGRLRARAEGTDVRAEVRFALVRRFGWSADTYL